MARLPQPGSDNGVWGDVLNDYLLQTLKPDGLLKDNAVTANTVAPNSITNAAIASDAVNATSIADGSITNQLIADGTIQETKLASAVQAKLNTTTPDADGSTKGKLQLAGDLAGTAASPSVAKIQGIAVNPSVPSDGQVLSYSTASGGWVPATVSNATVNDATTTSKGIVQLAGDLGGTASAPTVPGLASKAPLASPTFTGTVTVPTPANNTDAATKAYVDSQISGGSVPDADATTKGKVQLTGDLGGTAANPQVVKIQGIAVSGIPSNGQVLTASGGTAASWVTPTGTLPNLTAGSVPYSNGTTLAQDNNNFFWDSTNKRLGIGTNTPGTAIDIKGTDYASSEIQSTSLSDTANSIIAQNRARSGFTAVQTGDVLGSLAWRGYDGSTFGSDAASINVAAISNFTGTSHATGMAFGVTPDGSTSAVAPMTLYGDHLDINYNVASPTGVRSGVNATIAGKGDNASWKGVMAGYFQARDRDDVDATNKGVLMGLLAAVAPKVSRNNVPFDDVNGIMVSNEGVGKATDAIYIAKHSSFGGQSEWLTTFTSDADADSGIRMMGNYTYQMLNLSNKLVVDPNGALFMADQSEPLFPSGNGIPSGGGMLYVESSTLKYKQPNGTITTLANDGLVSEPKIDVINDTNDNMALTFSTYFTSGVTDGDVNYFTLYNNTPSGPPRLSPDGPGTNIGMSFVPKGNGDILIWSPSDTPTISGGGPSSNQSLNLRSNGTGVVQANGIEVATISGAQTLSNKTLNSPTLSGTVTAVSLADAATVNAGKVIINDAINTHPESSGFVPIPNLFNDIAYNNLRGGSVAVTKNGTTLIAGADYNPDNWFANAGFTIFASPAANDVFVITVTLCQSFQYGTYWGIQMGDAWMARDVKIELYYSGAWHSIYDTTNNNGYGLHWKQDNTSGSNAVTQVRYTLKNILQNGSLRVTSLFAVAYNSPLATAGFLPRSGGALYGTNAAPPTLTATGGDSNININLVPKGTGTVQANGVDVITSSGTQTLTNKTLSAPAVSGVASVATGGVLAIYNTADQTTNYERVRHYWSSNVYNIASENGGTGTSRNIQIATANRSLLISQTPVAAGIYQFAVGTSTTGVTGVGLNGSLTQSSSTFAALAVQPTVSQSSTAGYTALLVNPTESTTGSGAKLLADFQVGGTSYASISNIGVVQARNFAQNTATRSSAISLGPSNAGTNFCNAASGAFTITLPAASSLAGLTYIIKKTDSSANAVTVASAGGTIDGAATYALSAQYKYIKVTSDGSNWFIVGNN